MSFNIQIPPPPGPLIPGSANLQSLQVDTAKIENIMGNALLTLNTWKGVVSVASTTNVVLSGSQTIDGVTVVEGNIVLLKDQTTGSENGIWLVNNGSWTRNSNLPNGSNASGIAVFVTNGNSNADTLWVCSNNIANGIVGTDNLIFTILSGTGLQFTDNVKTAEPPTGSNISLNPAPAAINGYTLVNGDLVILMAQTDPIEDGIYKLNGTILERPVAGLYSIGSNVANAVTFVVSGSSASTSYVQTASSAVVGSNALSYSVLSVIPNAQGPQYAVQYADPAGIFNGNANFTWNGTMLDVTGEIESSGDITSTSGDIMAQGGDINCQGGDITAISGGVVANSDISAGGDVKLGNATNPTTLKTGASAAQNIILPDNAGKTAGDILTITDVATGATAWTTSAGVVGPATSVATSIPTFADATGKLLADASGITVPAAGQLVAATSVTATTGNLQLTAGDIIFGNPSGSHLNFKSGSGGATQNLTLPNMMAQGPGVFLMLSTPGFDMTGGVVPYEGETTWVDAPIYDGAFPITSAITRTVPYFDFIDWPDPTAVDPTATRGIATVKDGSGISIPATGQLVADTSVTATTGDIIVTAGGVFFGTPATNITLKPGAGAGSQNFQLPNMVGAFGGQFLGLINAATGATEWSSNVEATDITADGAVSLSATSTVGFYGTAPVAQQAAVAVISPAAGANPTKAEYDTLVTAFNDLVTKVKAYGLLA